MDIYNSRYFKINKKLLISCGLWPYEPQIKKNIIRTALIILFLVTSVPQWYGLHIHIGKHLDKIVEHVGILLYIYGILLKFVTTILAESKLKGVYENVAENWASLQDENERIILVQYSEQGRTLTVGYIIYMFSALTFYVLLPLTPKFLTFLQLMNQSDALEFVLKGEFPMDPYDHYIKIYIFDCFFCVVTVLIFCSIDCMYTACIEHCLGLFAIVKARLKLSKSNYFQEDHHNKIVLNHENIVYKSIIRTIKLHKESIRFTDILESSYSTSFLMLIGINMLYCSVLSVSIILKRDEMMERLRFTSVLGGLLIHLFYISWPGQKLIDHSSSLFEDTYMNEWYENSIRAQNLLRFMTLRCLTPCQLTAGGLYVMNFSNFAMILKTSLSYITVLISFT